MEKLDNITTLAGSFENYSGLQEYCDRQFKTIAILEKENKALKEEIVHLKDLLTHATELHTKQASQLNIKSNEHAICEVQIEKLREKAFSRELSLEETKRLEILIKSLHAIKEEASQSMEASFSVIQALPNLEQLAALAATPEAQIESD